MTYFLCGGVLLVQFCAGRHVQCLERDPVVAARVPVDHVVLAHGDGWVVVPSDHQWGRFAHTKRGVHLHHSWRWNKNKTRTSKVGAISKAQKRKTLEKIWIFWKKFFQKKSHSAEKCKRGTLLDLLTYIPLQNIKKLEGGPFGDMRKIFEKSRTVPKKSKGGTL